MKNLTLIFGLFLLCSCQNEAFKDNIPQILGINQNKVELEESHLTTSQFGGFGEGYALEVYKLSETTVRAFKNIPSKILPDKRESKNWKKHNWSKTPIDSSYEEIFILTLNYFTHNKELEEQLNEIKKVLHRSGTYYSFYYRPNKDNPQNVQLFVLDAKKRTLYAIESNI